MRLRFFALPALLCVGLCLNAQTSPGNSASNQKEEIPEIHGFDMSAMDRSADPCNDFYQFVCGSWVKNNPVPPDQGTWGRFGQLAERNRLIAKDILEQASANDPKRDAVHQKIGDYYQACMDDSAVNAKGLKPLQPEIDRITAIKDRNGLIDEIAHLHELGVRVLFSFGSGSDLHNADSVIAHFDQGGL